MYKTLFICFLLMGFKPIPWVSNLYKHSRQQEFILNNKKVIKIEKMEDFLKNNDKRSVFDGKDIVFLVTLSNQTKAVFKKSDTPTDKHIFAEIIAYNIAKKTELAYVPPVVIKKIEDQYGTLQIFEENADIIDNPYQLYKVDNLAFEELFLFDFITGNFDGGISNILLKKIGNHIYPVSIDHEFITHKQYAEYGKFWFGEWCACPDFNHKDNEKFPFNKIKKLFKKDIPELVLKCPRCKFFIQPWSLYKKYVIYDDRVFINHDYADSMFFIKCSKQTLNKIKMIDIKFLKNIVSDQLPNKDKIIADIIARKQQVLDKCQHESVKLQR